MSLRPVLQSATRALLIALLPVLVGLYVGATAFGGTILPWRPTMVDLDVYRRAGLLLWRGGDVYNEPGQLPFLYPPFAALLAVPLALLPATVVQVGWTVAGVCAVLAVLHRFGLTGWVLSLVGAAAIFFVEPVRETLGLGQVGIFLVALVFLDLAPGPRVLGAHRVLPEGSLTALAAAVKLTPAIFAVYLFASGRRRASIVMVLTGLGVTLLSAALVPAASVTFWGRLAHGDTGLGHSIIYYTNQSLMADVVRIFGFGTSATLVGLLLSVAVAALGLGAAVSWHRLGDVRLALSLCGVAGLLASPVSWLHHFVWIVPLALCLVQGATSGGRPDGAGTCRRPELPAWLLVLGWLFVGWVIASPFRSLPSGADAELQWTAQQQLLASLTALLGLLLLAGSLVATRPFSGAGRPISPVQG